MRGQYGGQTRRKGCLSLQEAGSDPGHVADRSTSRRRESGRQTIVKAGIPSPNGVGRPPERPPGCIVIVFRGGPPILRRRRARDPSLHVATLDRHMIQAVAASPAIRSHDKF